MLVIIDRFGTDERDIFKAWCWLKAHPSKGHIIMPAWLDSCFATWERQGQEGGRAVTTAGSFDGLDGTL